MPPGRHGRVRGRVHGRVRQTVGVRGLAPARSCRAPCSPAERPAGPAGHGSPRRGARWVSPGHQPPRRGARWGPAGHHPPRGASPQARRAGLPGRRGRVPWQGWTWTWPDSAATPGPGKTPPGTDLPGGMPGGLLPGVDLPGGVPGGMPPGTGFPGEVPGRDSPGINLPGGLPGQGTPGPPWQGSWQGEADSPASPARCPARPRRADPPQRDARRDPAGHHLPSGMPGETPPGITSPAGCPVRPRRASTPPAGCPVGPSRAPPGQHVRVMTGSLCLGRFDAVGAQGGGSVGPRAPSPNTAG